MMNNSKELIETNLITLTRHVLHDQSKLKAAHGDLTLLLVSIQLGCKFLSSQVRRAGLAHLTGLAGKSNVQGEEVKKLDVLANDIFINSLTSSGKVSVMVSEENEAAILVQDEAMRGKYCVVFDPLDGSSNIDSGVSIGTIFGVYHIEDNAKQDESSLIGNVLRPGREMVAAGYALYGSFTVLVLSTGNGVNGYTLDPNLGEFILTNPNMQMPKRGKIYSVNEGNSQYWHDGTKKYFEKLKTQATPYSARYVGSMVADVHRTFLQGGIFAYPHDAKAKNGKLRLLYECFPMAFLAEQAGGRAVDGRGNRILDIQPQGIHDRSPIILGSNEDVLEYESYTK